MLRLTRTIRFNLNRDGAWKGTNGHAGGPAPSSLTTHAEFEIACEGEPDPRTGYLINIKDIDAAAKKVLYPPLALAALKHQHLDPARTVVLLLPELRDAIAESLPGRLASVRWNLTPHCSIEVTMPNDQTTVALLRVRAEFAAAHRLHVPELSDDENRSIFGKCNHPSGHGHNYVVEPTVEIPTDAGKPPLTVAGLETILEETVLERFDHKHLNLDTDEFGPDGANPSVENIARVCYELMRPRVEQTPGVALRSVTVWETDRTRCTYPA
ncbi:MAG: 6-carboxytetrahydropterin synthase [Phycisphaerales bacterium JB040]